MSITPDTKNWTFVLERVCSECSFDVRSFPREQVGQMIRDNAAKWGPVLAHPQVTQRPSPYRWSALEYSCHVRDVFRLYDERLAMMIEIDDPLYPNWDQDAAAIEDRYGEQDPKQVGTELMSAAEALADSFDQVQGAQWERTGRRSDGANFTVESFARYLIHDPIHHIWDVQRNFEILGGRSDS